MKHNRDDSELMSLMMERELKRTRTMSLDIYPHQGGSNVTSPFLTATDDETGNGALMLSFLSSLSGADFAPSSSSGLIPIMSAPPKDMISLHGGGNQSSNHIMRSAPLPYKSFHLELSSSKTKAHDHWMNICRPLPGPPRLPSPNEVIKASGVSMS